MQKLLKQTIIALAACAIGLTGMAQAGQGENALEIYPPHAAPDNMTMMEQALHRRATAVAIWSMPLMNYKAIKSDE